MARFRYKAVDSAGEVVEGELDAETEQGAVKQLQSTGFLPIRTTAVSAGLMGLLGAEVGGRRPGLSRRETMILTRELATLLEAGIELERALAIVQTLSDTPGPQRVATRLLEAVRRGSTLADALSNHPETFSGLYVSMVRAGEAGGALEPVFARLAGYLEESERVTGAIRSSLVYPVILLTTAFLSLFALVGFVLPRFKALFDGAGETLPLPTRIVLDVGGFVETWWWAMLLAALAAFFTLQLSLRTPRLRLKWDRLALRAPLVGPLVQQKETANLSRTLGALLTNGVPMVPALETALGTIGNTAYRSDVAQVARAVRAGRGLSQELGALTDFPKLARQMISVGEESGRLESMLAKTAEVYDHEVGRAIQRTLSLVTPVVTLLLGLIIAGIISSILLAMLSLNDLAF